jgi:hypothetical protein
MRYESKLIAFLLLDWITFAVYAKDDAPVLEMPIACTIGVDCFVQNYVDTDPSSAYTDYHCGFLSYDEHKGTDFRLKSGNALVTEVPVLAAADGVVRATRDGMEDINVRVLGRAALQGKDAGNSVVIVHSKNWETQYAHLKKNSVAVKPGQVVSRGTVLGQVGLSGNTEFLHLHFELRHEGKAIDPFVGMGGGDSCALGKHPLWSIEALNKIPYIATDILAAGFTDHAPVANEELVKSEKIPANAPALVFWITLFGVQAADEEIIDLLAPDGSVFAHKAGLIDKNLAQYRSFIGKKRQLQLWSTGDYRIRYQLLRKQKTILSKEFSLQVF